MELTGAPASCGSLIDDSAGSSLGNISEIVSAVREQDPAAARHAMREHLMHSAVGYGLAPSALATESRATT